MNETPNEITFPKAQEWADEVMSMNRKKRREFRKKFKIPMKIAGSRVPLRKKNRNETLETTKIY